MLGFLINIFETKTLLPRRPNVSVAARHLYGLAGVAAVVGQNGGDGLQDFARVPPGHHQTEEAGAGQGGDGLSRGVVGSRAPDRGLQQQLEERL